MEMRSIDEIYAGKSVVVTGAAGSVGREIVRQLAQVDVRSITMLDNDETGLFNLDQIYARRGRISSYLTDIRDPQKLARHFHGADFVLHTAAYKHVPLCERSTELAVDVNVRGAQSVVEAACLADVERVLFTSSDKAVNPTNAMGATKLLGERIFTSSQFNKPYKSDTLFASTRFGNVVGSRGSVVPVFKRQIEQGGPVTLTDPEMTRFMMSIEQATALVIESIDFIHGGEVFVTKMPVFRIADLAEVLVEELAGSFGYKPEDIEIKVIGRRPGEKIFEELTTEEETTRGRDIGDLIVIKHHPLVTEHDTESPWEKLGTPITHNYVSQHEPKASKKEIRELLRQWGEI